MVVQALRGILRVGALALMLVAIAWTNLPTRTATATPMILYVKWDASGLNNGSSWTNAYKSLQTALDAAAGGGYEIWVAAGTYRPFRSLPPSATDTFQLHSGVALYGGFAGTETMRSQRNWKTNITTLDGHRYIPFNYYYAFHVVTGSGTNASAVLDGFTVTGGKASGGLWDAYGGGMQNVTGSPTVSNVIFSGNSAIVAAGMVNALNSNPTITNVTFVGNSATNNVGGMMSGQGNPTLTNVTFIGNSATNNGGAMYNYSTNLTLVNVTFSGNSATNGGAMYNDSSGNPKITNATFSGNSATNLGGGIYNNLSNPSIANSILWGNTAPWGPQTYNVGSIMAIAYSDVQGGYGGTGNINSDPKFIRNPSSGGDGTWGTADDDYGDLHLQPGSPAIDAGSNAAVPLTVNYDRDGNLRIMGKAVDMGAYEAFVKLFLPLIRK